VVEFRLSATPLLRTKLPTDMPKPVPRTRVRAGCLQRCRNRNTAAITLSSGHGEPKKAIRSGGQPLSPRRLRPQPLGLVPRGDRVKRGPIADERNLMQQPARQHRPNSPATAS
jgi:hypothetical protein